MPKMSATVAARFDVLNALRAKLGISALKVWSGSKEELENRITALQARVDAAEAAQPAQTDTTPSSETAVSSDETATLAADTAEVEAARPIDHGDNAEANAAKPAPKPRKAAKKVAEKAAPAKVAKANGATFTVADLARELSINPKVARAKLRRRPNLAGAAKDGWTFPMARRDEVAGILRG